MKTRLHPSIILEKLIASLVFIILIGYGAVLNVIEEAEDATKEIQNILSSV